MALFLQKKRVVDGSFFAEYLFQVALNFCVYSSVMFAKHAEEFGTYNFFINIVLNCSTIFQTNFELYLHKDQGKLSAKDQHHDKGELSITWCHHAKKICNNVKQFIAQYHHTTAKQFQKHYGLSLLWVKQMYHFRNRYQSFAL